MNANPRQQQLIDQVRLHGNVSVDVLARHLGVTPQTIRRDLRQLTAAGLLARFHGGAGVPTSTVENIAYAQRQSINADGKRRIGQAAARQVPNGSALILNIGTTVEEAARALRHHEGLRVVTNNLNVATILAPGAEVMVAGGVLRAVDQGIVGEATVDFMRQFKVDIGIIGISAIEADGTLRDFDYREVKVAQTIIAQSREVWLLADHTKFEREAMVEMAHLAQIDVLFTDQAPPPPMAALLRDAGVRCVIAD